MAVKIVRFIAGEELLGDVEQVDENTVRITNPTLISAMQNPKSGNMDVHMAPFAPLSASKSVEFSVTHVLCQYEPVVDIINKYNNVFGSRIVLPNSGLGSVGIIGS